MRVGTDTGFYIELLRGHPTPIDIWKQFMEGEAEGVCSALSVYELKRLGLKGKVPEDAADALLEALPAICRVLWITEPELLKYAARLSHGLGIPTMESLILAGMLDAKCEVIYTTDSHFEAYVKKGLSIINLGKSHERNERRTSRHEHSVHS